MSSAIEASQRAAIIFVHDSAVIDNYLHFYLQGLREVAGDIFIVTRPASAPVEGLEEYGRLLSLPGKVAEKLSSGDWGLGNGPAWAWALARALQGDKSAAAKPWQELICTSDQVFGPLVPLREALEKMAERAADLWELTARSGPSDFLVLRRSAWESPDFLDRLAADPSPQAWQDFGLRHELFIDRPQLRFHTPDPLLFGGRELYTGARCPLLSRRAFCREAWEILDQSLGDASAQLWAGAAELTQVAAQELAAGDSAVTAAQEKATPAPAENAAQDCANQDFTAQDSSAPNPAPRASFDMDLAWANLLRTQPLDRLVANLQLSLVLPAGGQARGAASALSTPPATPGSSGILTNQPAAPSQPAASPLAAEQIALVFHVYFPDLIDTCLTAARSMPPGSHLIFTTDTTEKAQALRRALQDQNFEATYPCQVRQIPNQGRDVSALLVGARDILDRFELVCFMHDKKVGQLRPGSKGEGFARQCFDLLASPTFVGHVIATFAAQPCLGLAMPLPPSHAEYFPVFTHRWGPNFQITKDLLERLGLSAVPLDNAREVIAPLGTMFWLRPPALRPLFEAGWDYADFPPEPNQVDGTFLHAIERAYCYVAQSQGYASAWLHSDAFAGQQLLTLSRYTMDLTAMASRWVWPAPFRVMSRYLTDRFFPIRALRPALRAWFLQRPDSALTGLVQGLYRRLKALVSKSR